MANEVLGHSYCPMCVLDAVIAGRGVDNLLLQEVRLSDKSKKPYVVCDECGAQTFARQPRSVRTLKNAVEKYKPKGEAVSVATPPAVSKPAAAPVASPKPVEAPKPPKTEPAEKPKPIPAKPHELPTMFDALESLFLTKTTTGEEQK